MNEYDDYYTHGDCGELWSTEGGLDMKIVL